MELEIINLLRENGFNLYNGYNLATTCQLMSLYYFLRGHAMLRDFLTRPFCPLFKLAPMDFALQCSSLVVCVLA